MIVSLEPELLAQLSRQDSRTDSATAESLDGELASIVRRAARMRRLFYAVVLVVALYGAATGAVATFRLPWWIAVGGVVALELGGVVFLTDADTRRRLGEHAFVSRLVGAVIAVAAATFNAASHDGPLLGGFFALMSALGFVSWWIDVENQRRDRLRARGQLPPPTPKYELWGHSIRHPIVTARARSLAKMYPTLGLYGSLEAALIVRRREQRNTALAGILRTRIRSAVGSDLAAVATHTFDIDEVARRLSAKPDYDGVTALLAMELTADRIVRGRQCGPADAHQEHRSQHHQRLTPLASSTIRAGRSERDSARAPDQRVRQTSRTKPGLQPPRITARRRTSMQLEHHTRRSGTSAIRSLDGPAASAARPAVSVSPLEGLAAEGRRVSDRAGREASGMDNPWCGTVQVKMVDGPMILDHEGQPVRGLRSKSFELLAFLVVHRSGAATADIHDAIWPGVPAERASQRLSTVVSNLRTVMRDVLRTGTPAQAATTVTPEPIINTGGRYHLNPTIVKVDCWETIDEARPTTLQTTSNDHGITNSEVPHLADNLNYPWLTYEH
jgi:hypothetical protein